MLYPLSISGASLYSSRAFAAQEKLNFQPVDMRPKSSKSHCRFQQWPKLDFIHF
jgi:hypothetical protein